jgi:hypothetical protein
MRSTYLNTLHTRSDKHKKRFAFAVSLGCTLMIFSIWSFVRLATPGTATAGTTPPQNAAVLLAVDNGDGTQQADNTVETVQGPTPFENFKSGLESSVKALKDGFSQAKDGAAAIQDKIQGEYTEVRTNTIDGSADNTNK